MPKEKITWSVKTVNVADLIENPSNPKIMNEAGKRRLQKSLAKFGLAGTIICNTDLMIVDGHSRKKELIEGGVKKVLASVPSRKLTKEEYSEMNAIFDLSRAGDADMLMVEEILGEELMQEYELDSAKKPEATEDNFDAAPPKNPITVLGDLYELGQHRLICGDSCNVDDVNKLMIGKKADLCFTDPPYGVDYSGGIQFKNGIAKTEQRERLKNDETDSIYAKVIPIIADNTNGPVYLWFAGTKAKNVYESIENFGEIHALLIWVKNGGFGALNANYKQKHEPCLYWKPKGAKLLFTGATNETTVWNIDKDGANKFHPTQKPISLAHKAIGNHSAGLILDLFGGSGSTLIASEQLNRMNYVMELDPGYCDVIVARYIRFKRSDGKNPDLSIKRNGIALKPVEIEKFLQQIDNG